MGFHKVYCKKLVVGSTPKKGVRCCDRKDMKLEFILWQEVMKVKVMFVKITQFSEKAQRNVF